MSSTQAIQNLFIENPKPFEGYRSHHMEVLVGGLDNQIYEVEKGHHLNWVRKHLNISDPIFSHELDKQTLTNEKTLPEKFYDLFPSFIRILVIENRDNVQMRSSDGFTEPELMAYFETQTQTPELRKTISRILRMFKGVETIQVYFHETRQLNSYSKRDWLISGLK